jgi:hypothetical protein
MRFLCVVGPTRKCVDIRSVIEIVSPFTRAVLIEYSGSPASHQRFAE